MEHRSAGLRFGIRSTSSVDGKCVSSLGEPKQKSRSSWTVGQEPIVSALQHYSTRTGSLLAREIPSFCIRK
jgi:hypothetical protein